MKERRLEHRMLCADLVEVSWLDKMGESRSAIANLEDISPEGACLMMETPVPLEFLLHVRSLRGDFTGCVRYCQYDPECGYSLGLEFDEGSHWSARKFRPRHMLDPHALLRRMSAKSRQPA